MVRFKNSSNVNIIQINVIITTLLAQNITPLSRQNKIQMAEHFKEIKYKVLFDGYSNLKEDGYYADCSCVLIQGPPNVIVDTMTSWDAEKILQALKEESLSCDDIQYVISTHGHSDHIGCNHLFKKAIHIVGYSISHRDKYFLDVDFQKGDEYIINEKMKVTPTPGHTLQDVSVILNTADGVVAVTGDLFEKFEDLENDEIWINAGSDSEELQRRNRMKILKLADYIIPGHGPMFKVPGKFKIQE